jgi:hypothetical protein
MQGVQRLPQVRAKNWIGVDWSLLVWSTLAIWWLNQLWTHILESHVAGLAATSDISDFSRGWSVLRNLLFVLALVLAATNIRVCAFLADQSLNQPP